MRCLRTSRPIKKLPQHRRHVLDVPQMARPRNDVDRAIRQGTLEEPADGGWGTGVVFRLPHAHRGVDFGEANGQGRDWLITSWA